MLGFFYFYVEMRNNIPIRKKVVLSFFVAFLVAGSVIKSQEKKIITPRDYFRFAGIGKYKMSTKGNYVLYLKEYLRGDNWLYLFRVADSHQDSFPCVKDFYVSEDERIIAIVKTTPYAKIRQLKQAKKKKEEFPPDTLWIIDTEKDSLIMYGQMEKYVYPVANSHFLLIMNKEKKTGSTINQQSQERNKKKKKQGLTPATSSNILGTSSLSSSAGKHKEETYVATLWKDHRCISEISGVTEACFSGSGNLLCYIQISKDITDSVYVRVHDMEKTSALPVTLFAGKGSVKGLAVDSAGQFIVWLFSADSGQQKNYVPMLLHLPTRDMDTLLYTDSEGKIWQYASIKETPSFNKNGTCLWITYIPEKEVNRKDTLLEEDKASLEIWRWNDTLLYPMQKVLHKKQEELRFPVMYVLHSPRSAFFLGNNLYRKWIYPYGMEGKAMVIEDYSRHLFSIQWETPESKDVYVIRLEDNTIEYAGAYKFSYSVSPDGKKIAYYDAQKKQWNIKEIKSGRILATTENSGNDFSQREHDLPSLPPSAGYWLWEENSEGIILYDDYDIWYLKASGELVCITQHKGIKELRRFRVENVRAGQYTFGYRDTLLVNAFDLRTKSVTLYHFCFPSFMEEIYRCDCAIAGVERARESSAMLFRQMTYRQYPDIYYSATSDLSEAVKISSVNPYISEYYWGDVKLVRWKTYSGKEAEGLLYVPEYFDTLRKYPLITYFYERNSDRLHYHYTPRPSASVINFTEYVSNGYVIFIPDIKYEISRPGFSAYDYVVSGVEHLIRKGFVDTSAIGIHGQSWGGYQTAFIITQTHLFKAAVAGAPVSNMISAYGGIRWESGMSRMFQYEKGQSRIGKSLWEDRESYFRNSPLFYADKIKTPLLIMANDKDGAVPWYQGIELFTALRRLNKPVWLLNYTGDDHNLTNLANKVDLSVRMKEFFDHFLKKTPPPGWLIGGFSPFEECKKTGFGLLKD